MTNLYTTALDQIPGAIVQGAIERGAQNNLLFCVGGGLGDQVCAEPTIRYAIDTYKHCSVSILTPNPELFIHLGVPIFKFGVDNLDFTKYLPLQTYRSAEHLAYHFFTPLLTNPVDYCSLTALRMQLPLNYRQIELSGEEGQLPIPFQNIRQPVLLHVGESWSSRTFPREWWESLSSWLTHFGCTPVWFGQSLSMENSPEKVLNLCNKLSLVQLIRMLQSAEVLVTNDSSPAHIAASWDPDIIAEDTGNAWIATISTVKHPDLLKHYRSNMSVEFGAMEYGWRMQDFSRGGLWEGATYCPNQNESVDIRNVSEEKVRGWLPDTQSLAEWAAERWELKQKGEGGEA